VIGTRRREGHEDRRTSVGRDLEDRAAGTRHDQVARRQRPAELLTVEILAQVVERAARAAAQRRPVALAGHVQDTEVRAVQTIERRLVDRPRPERAAEHEHALRPRLDPKGGARRVAIGGRRRHGAPSDAVALAAAPVDRKGQADTLGERCQHAVGQSEPAVGLGQHERDTTRPRRQRDRPGDVAAAAHHDIDAGEQSARAGHRAPGAPQRLQRPQRVAAVERRDRELLEPIAGGGHERALGAVATDEEDLSPPLPQCVGDRQGGHHVPGGPAGCDRDPRSFAHSRIVAFF